MSSPLGPHAWAYGNEALSDVTLAFVPKGAAAPAETSRGKKRKAQEGPDEPQAVMPYAEPQADESQAVMPHAEPQADESQAVMPHAEPQADESRAVVLHAEPQADVLQAEEPQATYTMPAHRLVLAAYSEFYKVLFVRWAKDDKTVKLEYDGPDDLAAAQACIKALYLQKLDVDDLHLEPQNAVSILVKAIRWADMLQAPSCTELCIARLADSFWPGSAEDVNVMLEGLPESVRSSPSFAKVRKVCQEWLQHTFTDVYEVITKEDLQKAFRQLCPRAVLLWMECDNLMGTENDVVALVTCWHEGEKGKASQEEDLVSLSRLLRVSQLARSIQECMLPELPWFREGRLLRFFWTAFRRYGNSASYKASALSMPDAWVAPARQSTAPAGMAPDRGPV